MKTTLTVLIAMLGLTAQAGNSKRLHFETTMYPSRITGHTVHLSEELIREATHFCGSRENILSLYDFSMQIQAKSATIDKVSEKSENYLEVAPWYPNVSIEARVTCR